MKPHMLLVGGATPRMMDQFSAKFEIHQLAVIDNLEAWLADNAEVVEAIATNGHDGVKPELMTALPNLKVISCYGVGYDAIDATEAAKRNIFVTHTPNVLNADVANLAVLLMLAVSRNLLHDYQWVTNGNWENNGNAPLTRSIEGKKVGIVGLGRIGAEIAKKLEVFNMEISYHTRSPKDVAYTYFGDLEAMAFACDYLVVITPGGAATKGIVNRKVMDALGPEGTLINVARGSVVDETELVAALKEGRLGWAGLDVFENEPKVPAELFEMENIVLTPHTASATVETRQAMGDLTVENLVRFFEEGTVSTPVPECSHMVG